MPLPGSWQILGTAPDGGIRVRYWWAMLNTGNPPRFDSTGWAEDILVRTAKGWKIKGTTWEESKRSGGSTDWFVDIQGKDIVNYELKEGPGFAIG